jgi:signal transduction histidine kinase
LTLFARSTGEAESTALGHFLVQSAVEEHPGKIRLTPLDGSGAEFRIELPLREMKQMF